MADSKHGLTAAQFVGVLRDLDLRPRSYSGRGMHGAACVGVTLPEGPVGNEVQLGALLYAEAVVDDGEEGEWLLEMLRHTRTDAMGLGTIVYWPDLDWPENTDEEDDDDE